MRLIALLDDAYHAHIFGYFWCQQFTDNRAKPIHLIVDTGCTTTTILSDDMTRLRMSCTGLNQSDPTTTANGQIIPYVLPNIELFLEFYSGFLNLTKKYRPVGMSEIHCHSPTDPQQMTEEKTLRACSLLGMDFLHYFKKWKFTENLLFLDT